MDKRKVIPFRDFIYLLIILAIILISVVSAVMSGSHKAGDELNFGATLVSIVLAVVAIVYTFVDSGGQKQNIIDLKETAKELDKSLAEVKQLISVTTGLAENFTTMINQNEVWREDIRNQIKSITENKTEDEKIDVEDLRGVLKNIEEKNTYISSGSFLGTSSIRNNFDQYILSVASIIKNRPEITDNELVNEIATLAVRNRINLTDQQLNYIIKKARKYNSN